MTPGLQEWIHRLEVGAGTRYIKYGLMVLAYVALALRYDLVEFRAFSTPEAMDFAQLGRNVAAGRGYTTRFIRPLTISMIQAVRGDNVSVLKGEQPDISNAPGYPLILAGLFKALPFDFTMPQAKVYWWFKPEIWLAIFQQCLFFAALVALFLLARKLFDESVAIVSVFIIGAADVLWRFSIAGLPTFVLLLVFLGIVTVLISMEEAVRENKRTAGWFCFMAVILGGLVAIGAYTRYGFAFLLVPIVVYGILFLGARRVMVSVISVGVVAVALAPWCVRNYHVCGKVFGTAGLAVYETTGTFPGIRMQRLMPRNLDAELNKASLNDFIHKAVGTGGKIIRDDLPKLGGNWATAGLFVAGLMMKFRDPRLGRLRVFLLLGLLTFLIEQALCQTQISVDSPEVNSENFLVLFGPLVVIFGVAMYFTLLDQVAVPWPQIHVVISGGFIVVASLPLIITLLPPRPYPVAYPPYYPPMIARVTGWFKADELIMSDIPWALAWYGNQQAVWLTMDTGADRAGDFYTINDYQKPIHALFLTSLTIDDRLVSEMMKGQDHAWSRFVLESVLQKNVPIGFPLLNAPTGFMPDFLFLTDRRRWKNEDK